MKPFGNQYRVNVRNPWGRYSESWRQQFQVTETDVGDRLPHSAGKPRTFTRNDIGRYLEATLEGGRIVYWRFLA